jgi:hypothetical protein
MTTVQDSIDQLGRELAELKASQASTARALRRWSWAAMLILGGAAAVGLGGPAGFRAARAQAPEGPGLPIVPVFQVGRYYINLSSVEYAYYSNSSLIVQLSGTHVLTLNATEAQALVRLLAPIPAQGPGAPGESPSVAPPAPGGQRAPSVPAGRPNPPGRSATPPPTPSPGE